MLGVYGAGGCGRGIMPIVREQYANTRAVFVEDSPRESHCNGHPVLPFSEFVKISGCRIVLAVSDSTIRAKMASRCTVAQIDYFDARASQMVVMDDVVIGPGALFSPWTTVCSNVRIGAHFQCNLYSYIEHDCIIGNFVAFAPSVKCNGNVTIGDGAYIGSNAVIRQGVVIGENATIGMGAVVLRDVADGETVVGNPARPLRRL